MSLLSTSIAEAEESVGVISSPISDKNKIIAASTGAVMTSLTMTPFDVVKTRLQTQQSITSKRCRSLKPRLTSPLYFNSHSKFYHQSISIPTLSIPPVPTIPHTHSLPHPPHQPTNPQSLRFTGFVDAVIKIAHHEGIPALWRGTLPALAMSVPGQIIYMMGYDSLRSHALSHAPPWAYSSPTSSNSSNRSHSHLTPQYLTLVPLVSGALARTVVATLFSPLELLRTRQQASSTSSAIFPLLRSIIAEGGIRALYKGLSPTLWRDVPFSAVYWTGYEVIKRCMTGGQGMGEFTTNGKGEFGVAFVSGAGSGMIAATVTNPFDVIKTRRQGISCSHSSSPTLAKTAPQTSSLFFQIIREEGYRGLFKGLTPRLAKVGPACGIMIGCYEGLGRLLDEWN